MGWSGRGEEMGEMDWRRRGEMWERDWYRGAEVEEGGGEPVFFTTSSPSIYKGFETIIDTARVLVKRGVKFQWVVAGLKADQPLVRLTLKERGVDDPGALNILLAGTLNE